MKREEKKKLTKREQFAQLRSDFSQFLYKKEEDEAAVIMGRTALSWGKVGVFFFVYYACLTAFFAAMFAIAFSTMPDIKDGPKYTSLISDKPLLLVYPDGISSYEIADFNKSIKSRYEGFLHGYRDTKCYLKEKCKPGDSYRPEEKKKQCGFDLSSLGPCAPNTTFGYKSVNSSPCLYLRLSKIYGWKPEPRNSKMFVELECEAEDDKNTQIDYYPKQKEAFPISFWPFRGESGFRTPIAAIQVKGNKGEVTIKCKAIADNIELSDTYKLKRGAHGQIEFTVAAQSSD